MKPWKHSLVSVKHFGGKPEDYLPIHDFIDSSKMCMPDMRHRAILHSAFGIFIAERVFGTNITNSENKLVSVRDVAERHVIDDLGFIPTVQDYLKDMPFYDWLGGTSRPRQVKEDLVASIDGKEEVKTAPEGRPASVDMSEEQKEMDRLEELKKKLESMRNPRTLVID